MASAALTLKYDPEVFAVACRKSFDAFTARAFGIIEPGTPFEWNWHIGCIAEHLEAVHRGEIKRIIINEPPRCLKSVQVAQCYPAWVMGHQPHHQFISASYAHSLAERNVVKTRKIMTDEWYRYAFPDTFISADQNTKDYFTTTQNGQYLGTGIGGTITGFGCDTLLIDDPINPMEAASETIRATAIREIRSTLFSRYNDSRVARTIVIMQRLHEADPTGDLLQDEGWYHLKLPALASKPILITLGDNYWTMKAGDLLDANRLPKAVLDQKRTDLGDYNYVGQYMQEPVPIGGGELKPEWVQYYELGSVKPTGMNIYIIYDAADSDEMKRKKRRTSDYSAYMVIGCHNDNNYYLLDIVRDRFNPTQRIDTLFALHRKWAARSGKSPKVATEKYGLMNDTHYIEKKQREDNYRFNLITLRNPQNKEDRIRRIIPDLQHGRWWFPQFLQYRDMEGKQYDLVAEMTKGEMPTFPRARFDDMLDALTRIYDDEMQVVFPMQKKSDRQKAIDEFTAPRTESWLNL